MFEEVSTAALRRERTEWRLIQERKRMMVRMNQPYEERIRTFNLKLGSSKKRPQTSVPVRPRATSAITTAPPADNGIPRNFKQMSINELKHHEKGILNLYE